MKKRILAFFLAVCIATSMFALPASAVSVSNNAIQTAITLGALDMDAAEQADGQITRGAFAKMLVSFSIYRESVGSQGSVGTLYKDVPGSSQWAPYIRIAVQNGWMNGYTDGTFRPEGTITLEAACTAVLKMLGYKTTELSGTFPAAQLNKAAEIGLRDQLGRAQGENMTCADSALLLYNALKASTASGGTYGTTLGFTVSNGQVDVSSVLLSSLKGPFVAVEDEQLPFEVKSVYRNDKASDSAELNQYDVYYYSESLQTVWIYTRRAAGRITAVSPSASAPTGLTVAGNTYSLGSTAVASKVSSLNGGGVGEVVTLLLGMDNEVADIITGAEADEVFYGVVQSASRTLTEENGADVLQKVSVMCTDGVSRTIYVDKSLNYPTGWLVELSASPEGESIHALGEKHISGTVSSDATMLGDYVLADDVQILETTSEGVAGTVRPSRIEGSKLSRSDVRYYTLNEKGEIDRLILDDVTGDLWSYGVLDDIKNLAANLSAATSSDAGVQDDTNAEGSLADDLRDILVPTTSELLWDVLNGNILSTVWGRLTGNTDRLLSLGMQQLGQLLGEPYSTVLNYFSGGATYVCYINGSATSLSTSVKYPVIAGGLAVRKELNGAVEAMVQLMPIKIDKVGAASVLSGSDRYPMSDDVQVYLWYKGQYYATKLSAVNTEEYSLTGWYDNFGCAAGKRVRVIVAVKND